MNMNEPAWYQRLNSFPVKPELQTTFRQYCQENETRMKVLYPFLPLEQIKGKLLARWKRRQQPQHKAFEKRAVKKLKRTYFPVVQLFSNSQITSTEKMALTSNWLNEAFRSKTRGRDTKTYKSGSFMLPQKVPEIVFHSSSYEKGILKNGRTGSNSFRKNQRHPASRVRFTSSDKGNMSILIYPHQTHTVASPDAECNEMENNVTSSVSETLKESVPTKHRKSMCTAKPHFTSRKRKLKLAEVKKNSAGIFTSLTQAKQNFLQNLKYLSQPMQPLSSTPTETGKISDIRQKSSSKSQQDSSYPDTASPFYQNLEPPKFGPIISHTLEEGEKRFCLFEDECIKPELQKNRLGDSKSSRQKQKRNKYHRDRNSFSWSPAAVFSQNTPKLKKSKNSLFSQEKPETYHRPKSSVCRNKAIQQTIPVKANCGKQSNNTHSTKSLSGSTKQKKSVSPVHLGSKSLGKKKIQNTTKTAQKKQMSQSCTTDLYSKKKSYLKANASVNRDTTIKIGELSQQQDNTFNSKPSQKEMQQVSKTQHKCKNYTVQQTNKTSEHQSSDDKLTLLIKQTDKSSPVLLNGSQKNDQKENVDVSYQTSVVSHFAKKNNDFRIKRRCNFKSISPPSSYRFQLGLNPTARNTENDCRVDQPEGYSVLQHILFQLKNITTSSQNPDVSPAQSRLTEVNKGDGYRKDDNILCNLFDISSSADTEMHNKMKRNLPSGTCPEESDVSMFFNADIFA